MSATTKRQVAVVTGSRAEYGLLRPVMRAIERHNGLELRVVVVGAHLLGPRRTADEVATEFDVAVEIPMQRAEALGRWADAAALGRGVTGITEWLAANEVDFVVVLGDRIEAFAAAAAAAVGGVRVVHMHGGDRAEGIADEALRHAITRLAHLHLPATPCSARRIEAMGEDARRIHVVGSPALDDLAEFPQLSDDAFASLGRPEIVILLHPLGRAPEQEQAEASRLAAACGAVGRVLWLYPNHDPGREGIVAAIESSDLEHRTHLPRREFVGLLRRARLLAGNSSAGLIEAAALGLATVNVGSRQGGREMPDNVIDLGEPRENSLAQALSDGLGRSRVEPRHPYGDGHAGQRVATILATLDPAECPLAKRNGY